MNKETKLLFKASLPFREGNFKATDTAIYTKN